jgi:hypothetical protein
LSRDHYPGRDTAAAGIARISFGGSLHARISEDTGTLAAGLAAERAALG